MPNLMECLLFRNARGRKLATSRCRCCAEKERTIPKVLIRKQRAERRVFLDLLAKTRVDASLTQATLAAATGVSQPYVSQVESRKFVSICPSFAAALRPVVQTPRRHLHPG